MVNDQTPSSGRPAIICPVIKNDKRYRKISRAVTKTIFNKLSKKEEFKRHGGSPESLRER